MSPTELRWRVGGVYKDSNDVWPQALIHDRAHNAGDGWQGRIHVFGESEAEAEALATKVVDFLNADEELHRGTR